VEEETWILSDVDRYINFLIVTWPLQKALETGNVETE
jgi:hypothetical protein